MPRPTPLVRKPKFSQQADNLECGGKRDFCCVDRRPLLHTGGYAACAMNLVGGYDSSDDDDEQQQQPPPPQQQQQQLKSMSSPMIAAAVPTPAAVHQHHKARGKGKAPAAPAPATSRHRHGHKKRRSKLGSKSKTKVVNALVLSPEIQAALARGDALGDSDSDEAPEKKPPKISRPAGSNPNNLLSLLPKPSTTTSVDDILLKSQQKRRDVAAAKTALKKSKKAVKATEAATEAASATAPGKKGSGKISRATTATPGAPDHAVTSSPPGGGGGGGGAEYAAEEEKEKEPDSDGDGDDLLASIYEKTGTSGASAGSGSSSSISTPLFTLPSRAKPGGAVGAALLPDNGKILDEEGAGVGVIPGIEHGGMPPQMEKGSQGQCAGQWGEMPQGEGGLAYAWQEGEASQAAAAETGGGAYEMAYGASVEVRFDTYTPECSP